MPGFKAFRKSLGLRRRSLTVDPSESKDGKSPKEKEGHVPSTISRNPSAIYSMESDDVGYMVAKVRKLPKLHRAVWKCNMDKVENVTRKIKTKKLNAFDKKHRTALHLACSKAHADIIVHLCAIYANVNLQDADGATPMHKLIETGNTACLQMLVNFGGNPNLTDRFGRSPLHLVARIGDVAASIVLLEADAIVDSTDVNGMTALHVATLYGHLKLVASLINDGFYIDAQDGQGRTSLMIAAGEGHVSLLKLLAKKKADPKIVDMNKLMAIDYAKNKNYSECVEVIEDHEKFMERKRQLEAQKSLPVHYIDHEVLDRMCRHVPNPSPNQMKTQSTAESENQPTKTEDTPSEVTVVETTPTDDVTSPETDACDDDCDSLVELSESEDEDDERFSLWRSLVRSTSPVGPFPIYKDGDNDSVVEILEDDEPEQAEQLSRVDESDSLTEITDDEFEDSCEEEEPQQTSEPDPAPQKQEVIIPTIIITPAEEEEGNAIALCPQASFCPNKDEDEHDLPVKKNEAEELCCQEDDLTTANSVPAIQSSCVLNLAMMTRGLPRSASCILFTSSKRQSLPLHFRHIRLSRANLQLHNALLGGGLPGGSKVKPNVNDLFEQSSLSDDSPSERGTSKSSLYPSASGTTIDSPPLKCSSLMSLSQPLKEVGMPSSYGMASQHHGVSEGVKKKKCYLSAHVLYEMAIEIKKAEELNKSLLSELEAASVTKTALEKEVGELNEMRSRCELEVIKEKTMMKDTINELEAEISSLKKVMEESCHDQAVVEKNLLVSTQHYEAHIKELNGEIAKLSFALDEETAERKTTEDMVSALESRMNVMRREVDSLNEEAKVLRQESERIRTNALVTHKDLEVERDKVQQMTEVNRCLENKLQKREDELRSSHALQLKQANDIVVLQKEKDDKEIHISSMKEKLSCEKEQRQALDQKTSEANQKVASLQAEAALLKQKLTSTSEAEQKLNCEIQTMRKKLDELSHHHEEKVQTLMEQLATTKEGVVRKEMELKAERHEKEMAQSNVSEVTRTLKVVRESMSVMDETYRQLEEEKVELMQKIQQLEQQLMISQETISELDKDNAVLTEREKRHLSQIDDSMQAHTAYENLLENQQRDIVLLERDLKRWKLEHKECMEQEKLKAAAATKKSDKMEAMLREERAKAQREMAALKSQLQDSKTHIHQLKLRECHIPEMKAEFDRERATLQNELTALKAVLEDTKKELEREVELRHMIENDIFISKQDLDTMRVKLAEGESDALLREQELSRTVKMSKRLSQKLKQLKEHVATNMVNKSDMEYYKKSVDEKARQQISQKLEVIDAHMKQQSEAREALAKLRSVTENEWKQKYNLVTDEMRRRVEQLSSERERLRSEVKNYKELYETEIQRSRKLSNTLHKM